MAERPRFLIAGGSGVFGRLLARDLLPLAVRVTECQMVMRRCPECGKCTRAALPAGAPRRPFGVRLTAVIALLRGRYRLSRREVRQLLQDLWEVKLSLGAVVRQEQAQSAVLAPIVAEAQAAVQQAAVINLDETGWRQEDQRAWLWTAVTATLTLFRIDRSRGGRSGSAAGRGVCGGGRVGPLVGVWPIPGRATGAVLRAPQTRRKRSAPWPAGSSDGGAVPNSAASPAAARKSSSSRPCCRQVAATVSSRFAVRALLPTPEQPSQPRLKRDQASAQRVAVELPRLKSVPHCEQRLDFRQAPAANRCRRPTPVHQPLEVAL